MVTCPKCGKQIRYINASKITSPESIFVVDPQPREIISERGRILTGFSLHACKGGQDGKEETSGQASTETQ